MKHFTASVFMILPALPALIAGCAGYDGKSGLSESAYTIRWDDDIVDTAKNAEYLSAAERRILAEINKVRVNPKGYAAKYVRASRHCKSACEPIAERLSAISPMAPLLPSRQLHLAAKMYVETEQTDVKPRYSGRTKTGFRSRIERYAQWKGFIAESISYGEMKPEEIVINYLVRENAERQESSNLLNPNFQYAGVSLGVHKTYRYVCVVDFATDVQAKTHKIQNP